MRASAIVSQLNIRADCSAPSCLTTVEAGGCSEQPIRLPCQPLPVYLVSRQRCGSSRDTLARPGLATGEQVPASVGNTDRHPSFASVLDVAIRIGYRVKLIKSGRWRCSSGIGAVGSARDSGSRGQQFKSAIPDGGLKSEVAGSSPVAPTKFS